eukprot:302698_1
MFNTIQRELLVFGYFKEIECMLQLTYGIPNCIKLIIEQNCALPFVFDKNGIEDVEVSVDRLTLRKLPNAYVTLRFGQFVDISQQVIINIVIHFTNAEPIRTATGFITPEYIQPQNTKLYNSGENHSMLLYGDGAFVTTKEDFKSKYDKLHLSFIDIFYNFWRIGDKINIEVDMINQKGKMWNEKDKQKDKMFEVQLPKCVAVCVSIGGSIEQTVSVVSCSFQYNQNI